MKKAILITLFSVFFLFPRTTYAECGTISNVGFCELSISTVGQFVSCSGSNDPGEPCCETSAECPAQQEESPAPVPINVDGPNNEIFDALNPLINEGDPDLAEELSSPGGIVSRVLIFLFPLAGLALFAMLVWGGFEILAKSAQSQKALDAGKNRITAAIVGFLLLFATYWMAQIIEAVFGIVIV